VRCADAYYVREDGGCGECTVGAFCANGTRTLCEGPNLTTATTGASSPLQCIPTSPDAEQLFRVGISFALLLSQAPPSQCLSLHLLLVDWLRYGALVNCMLTMSAPANNFSQSMGGEVQCTVATSAKYSGEYLGWLVRELWVQKLGMQLFLVSCLQRADLIVTDLVATPVAAQAPHENSTSAVLLAYPILSYDKPGWGHTQADIVTFLGSAVLLSSAMLLSIGMLAAGLCLKKRRRA